MMDFKTVKPEQLSDNPFKLIGRDWMLITAVLLSDSRMCAGR